MPALKLDAKKLEQLTRAYGQEIFARVSQRSPLLFTPAWWDERLMGLTMHDEAVKVQLFRFIDVLPQLRGTDAITRHLSEYFHEARAHLPGWARLVLRLQPQQGLLADLIARTARRNAENLARKFIAGANLEEAINAVERLRRKQLTFTVDLLGEATITEKEAEKSQRDYLELLAGLSEEVNAWPARDLIDRDAHGPLPRVNVSIKLSSLFSQFDPMAPDHTSASSARALAAHPTFGDQASGVRQFRHGAIGIQGVDDPHFPGNSRRGGIPLLARRRHSDSGVPAVLRGRLAKLARLGETPRHSGRHSAHQRGVLGLRNGGRRPGRLAIARVRAQMGDRRLLRADVAVFDRESSMATAGVRQP